eukprot:Anaeramoba_ignava/a478257_7.p2 GENE.a478257_7~~a478257_7.p2  ORF type:complete len:169 (+),score=12.07 a478257_7:1308-1814(+)
MLNKSKKNKGFSLIEIMLTLVFISLAFLPIYNLFRFGSAGTANNISEVTATNYASDMVNFLRELKVYQIKDVVGKDLLLKNDEDISKTFKKIGLAPPVSAESPFLRSLELKKFKGKNKKGILGISGFLSDLINQRRAVPNYLAKVKVEFPRNTGKGKDDVTLYTIIMD